MRSQIDVDPGRVADEAQQEAGGEDVIGLAVERALLDVGHVGIERAVVIRRRGEGDDALAGLRARARGLVRQRRIGGEDARHAHADGDVHGTGERSEIDDLRRLLACRERKRIGQRHAAFGVGVDDLDGRAVQGLHDFARPVGVRPDMVFRNGEPGVDVHRPLHAADGRENAEHHCRTVHVLVHPLHVARRLEIVAAGIEADALAHQRQRARLFAGGAAIRQPHDRGILHRRPLGHGTESARAHFLQLRIGQFLHRPAVFFCQRPDPLAVRSGRQCVGRQRSERTAQHVALGNGAHAVEAALRRMAVHRNALHRRIGFRFLRRQRHAVHQRDVGRRCRRPCLESSLAEHGQRKRLGMLGQQRCERLADMLVRGEGIGLQCQHGVGDERAAMQLQRHRRLRQRVRFHAAALQRIPERSPAGQLGQALPGRQQQQRMACRGE